MAEKIKVLIVDDALVIRMFLRSLLSTAADIDVVGVASDPLSAQPLLNLHKPDVMTLDVEMPHMDGITFLEKLMRLRPMPVVMFSTLTHKGAASAVKALSLGAVEVLGKPNGGFQALQELADDILRAVRAAAVSRIAGHTTRTALVKALTHMPKTHNDDTTADLDMVLPKQLSRRSAQPLIMMGASTGGTEALRKILPKLHKQLAPIVVVQHMPEKFTAVLAESLSKISRITVEEAKDGTNLLPGHAYIAPGGGCHLTLIPTLQGYRTNLLTSHKVNHHRPAVDVLFRSAANCVAGVKVGIVLTGMGNDGARGLHELHQQGAVTITQDEASCVIYGMPRAAHELNPAAQVLSPEQIVQFLNNHKGVHHG